MRALAALALLLAWASPARADSGAAFGESARAASLASSVLARPGDTSAIYFNPAGVADVDRPTLTLLGHAGFHRQRFARTGELGDVEDRAVTGYGVSVVAPLPGPPWLRRVRLGGSVHLPGETIIGVDAPVRRDAPVSLFYGNRTERTAVTFAASALLPWTIRIGVAVTVTPTLFAPTSVGFDANRGATVDEGVAIAQQRDLTLEPSVIVGARAQPLDELAIGLVFRQGGATRANGTFDIRAGAIRVLDEYSFYSLIAPMEVGLGVAVWPLPTVSISLDATWARWSTFRTIHDEAPDPGLSDTVELRAGLEWSAHRALAARLGYAFLPSPVPEQTGFHNLLDAHRHEVAFGVGLDLEPLTGFALRIDLAARFHAMHEQEATKAPGAFAGAPIDNLGYPGFSARGSFQQLSLSLTFGLGDRVSVEDDDDARDEAAGDEAEADEAEPDESAGEEPPRAEAEHDSTPQVAAPRDATQEEAPDDHATEDATQLERGGVE
ncbi:MAG: hypothetical protein KF729_00890 [Sandaracinaceae bacterium]|nr:hypothetical protein [Sandaracinaceae bacterium]